MSTTKQKEKPIKLEFGISPPTGITAAWGARALYTWKGGPQIELLWDRQSPYGPEDQRRTLCKWVNEKGLELLKKELDEKFITSKDDATVTVKDGPYTIVASPKRSYGYLYIGAWSNDAVSTKERIVEMLREAGYDFISACEIYEKRLAGMARRGVTSETWMIGRYVVRVELGAAKVKPQERKSRERKA
jgi:hypothetical protein